MNFGALFPDSHQRKEEQNLPLCMAVLLCSETAEQFLNIFPFICWKEHSHIKRMHNPPLEQRNPAVQTLQKPGQQQTYLWLSWLIRQLNDQGLVVLLSISELSLDLAFVFITKHLWALAVPEEFLIMDLQVSYYFLVVFLTHCFQLK